MPKDTRAIPISVRRGQRKLSLSADFKTGSRLTLRICEPHLEIIVD